MLGPGVRGPADGPGAPKENAELEVGAAPIDPDVVPKENGAALCVGAEVLVGAGPGLPNVAVAPKEGAALPKPTTWAAVAAAPKVGPDDGGGMSRRVVKPAAPLPRPGWYPLDAAKSGRSREREDPAKAILNFWLMTSAGVGE